MENVNETDTETDSVTVEKKLTRKERKERWKALRRERRQAQKDYYKYAPWIVRVWNLYLKKPCCVLLVICLITGLCLGPLKEPISDAFSNLFYDFYFSAKDAEISDEEMEMIYEMSPVDEKGDKKIDAFPAIGSDETWTICVYMVGSDLEDAYQIDLSELTVEQTTEKNIKNEELVNAQHQKRFDRFTGELAEKGLEIPAFFYYPVVPVASSVNVTEDVIVSDRRGAATDDISEICSDIWSDNIRIVIQTGGATHWTNKMINPNRTQRFVYEKGKFTEVENLPLQEAATTETLTDFISFCNDNYRSDHNMLVFWDHGSGPFGYGYDRIYNKTFSMKEIRTALEKVYGPSPAKSPYDIIGFDACLMSELTVANLLSDYADYFCVSEEVEPGDGWAYDRFLEEMSDNPTMSAPQVCRAVADAYTDYYMQENVNFGLFYENSVTFSVLDAGKSAELFKAYSELCKKQLIDASSDLGVLSEMGRHGMRSTRYAMDSSDVFNMSDLGNYVDYLVDSYPDECSRIKKLIGETVLYHRENGSVSDSTGIAVYLPSQVDNYNGLLKYLNYIYDIVDDENIRTLYYYKQAGCLNDEMTEYVKTLTHNEPEKLDLKLFNDFTKAKPTVGDGFFSLPVSEDLQNLMVGYYIEVGNLNEEKGIITDYGANGGLELDGDGCLISNFDGKWPYINDVPLYVEVVSNTASDIEFRAHVEYNGEEAYLILNYDKDTEKLAVNSVRKVEEDNANYMDNTKSSLQLQNGDTVTPLYLETNLEDDTENSVKGTTIKIKNGTDYQMKVLPKGYYLGTVVITDPRGDSYYSAVVGADIGGSGIKRWKIDDRFRGSNY